MKKKFLTIALAGLLAFSAFSFGGCADSAYDIAVKNGFTGTEAEWLQSLQGANGEDAPSLTVYDVYESAVEKGDFVGTFNEFLKQYMSLDVSGNNDVETLSQNVLSTVSIYTGFVKTVPGLFNTTMDEIYCSAGSGVIVDLDLEHGNATVITNYHVVYDSLASTPNGISESIYLYLYGARNGFNVDKGKDEGGDGIKARFVGGSMDYDIAVLKIEGSEILKSSLATEAKFGDSNKAAVGEKVFVIGNPEGLGISVSQGVISVDSEYISMKSLNGANRIVSYRVMRTDAAINGGNSGGPLFNSRGELIAIINAKSVADGVENMGYALPAAQVQGVMQNIENHGSRVKRATLGIMVAIEDTTVSLTPAGTLSIQEKLVIDSVERGVAAEGRLKAGDIMKSMTIKGETYSLDRRFYITDLLLSVQKGESVTILVERDGVDVSVEIPFVEDRYFTSVM